MAARYYRADNYLWIKAIEEDGKYKLLFTSRRLVMVATKNSRKAHTEAMVSFYDKVFDSKDKANRYFKAVKKNNPNLRQVTLAEYQKETI